MVSIPPVAMSRWLPFARRNTSRDRYEIERLETPEAVVAACGVALPPTAFQAPPWLRAAYATLAPAIGAHPLGLAISMPGGSARNVVLALEVHREGGLVVARFADFGVADYNAPLGIGSTPAEVVDPIALMAAVTRALRGVDVVHLERMIVARNPLATHPGAMPARHDGNSLTIIDSVDDYIRSRGKKYRKEIERCTRVLASEGAWAFTRAATPGDIEAACTALDAMQSARHADKTDAYALSEPRFSAFYRAVLADPSGLAQIFTLTLEGRIIAVLMGTVQAGTFTLLRIANGGEQWRHFSPGRLIVVEAMRHFCARNVKTFDMGIGDYAFKRGFGTEPVPLVDLVVPITWLGLSYATAVRVKARLRRSPWVRAMATRIRG
jgi:CelD/BcsL family acetyltransferase involved in cellulose biosynthesis